MRVFLVLSILFCAAPLLAKDYPDYREVYVNDFADLLGDTVEDDIRERLKALRSETGIEFAVVTIGNMSEYGHHGEIEPFATGLFNNWGVGDGEKNDGLMMLVSRWDRKIRLEVGSGYGATMNVPMQRVIDDDILPYFRDDRYEEGISNGVNNVILAVTGSWPGEYDYGAPERIIGSVGRFIAGLGNWIWVVLAGFVPFPVMIYRRWKRNVPRICPNDGAKMARLDEDWDDNHLQKGQITEEELRSVDYDVWQCSECEHVKIEGYRAWFSHYSICRNCAYRTVEGETTILKSATTTSTGLKRIDYHCRNCGDDYSVTRTIPKVSESSSSSSSFGGGSSSGGGASGSW